MASATVNFRMDKALKGRVDTRLKNLDSNATDAITQLYRYIDQHGRLPFLPEQQVMTAGDVLLKIRNTLLSSRDVLLVTQIRQASRGVDDTIRPEALLLARLSLSLGEDISWLQTAESCTSAFLYALNLASRAQFHIGASRLIMEDSQNADHRQSSPETHLTELQHAIADLDDHLRNIGCMAPASMPEATEYDGAFCHVRVNHQLLRRPVPLAVTVTLRPDVMRLVETQMPEACPLLSLPGWNCKTDFDYWSHTGVVDGVPGEGFRFKSGKVVFYITPATAEPMPTTQLAGYVGTEMERLIRALVHG